MDDDALDDLLESALDETELDLDALLDDAADALIFDNLTISKAASSGPSKYESKPQFQSMLNAGIPRETAIRWCETMEKDYPVSRFCQPPLSHAYTELHAKGDDESRRSTSTVRKIFDQVFQRAATRSKNLSSKDMVAVLHGQDTDPALIALIHRLYLKVKSSILPPYYRFCQ